MLWPSIIEERQFPPQSTPTPHHDIRMVNVLDRRRVLKRSAAVAAVAVGGLQSVARADGDADAVDAAEKWGDLVGRFVYDGKPSPRNKLTVDKDLDCCGKFDIRDESLMVGPDGGLGNVFVYLRTRGAQICPELAQAVEASVLLDNRDCIFIPHCLTIWRDKQKLRIVNSDPVAQNVAFSPLGDVPANIVLPPPPHKASEATWSFRRGQRKPFPIACNYHPWESAYILPLDSPYATVSNPDGTFRIPKLPLGKLEFQIWHENVAYLDTSAMPKGRVSVTIKPGENDLGTIRLSPASLEKK
jgi:hypothetical protein